MPSLSDFQSFSSVGQANTVVPAIVDEAFANYCANLITQAYDRMRLYGRAECDWKETRFSAHLMKFMLQVRDDQHYELRIDPELHLYDDETLDGLRDPDTAPRIDIRVAGAWIRENIYYAVEGKILVERDWGTRSASGLRSRYIATGIDNYKNGNYSPAVRHGCVVGYVVQGNPSKVASQINRLLSSRKRKSELLGARHTINSCTSCYHSTHVRTSDGVAFYIRHILLNCS